jgi:hypothetical protein
VNLYFLVEGDRTETKLYRHWIRHALPHLSEVDLAADLTGNRFYIISGGGYPSYVDRIRDSLLDLKDHPSVDHFFICIDSEELSYAEKLAEIVDELARAEHGTRVRDCNPHFRSHLIVQHCCAETWFLGHRRMMTRNPTSPDLLRFQRFFDVRTSDPEGMECLPGYVTRASFHLAYLKAMLVAKNPPAPLHQAETGGSVGVTLFRRTSRALCRRRPRQPTRAPRHLGHAHPSATLIVTSWIRVEITTSPSVTLADGIPPAIPERHVGRRNPASDPDHEITPRPSGRRSPRSRTDPAAAAARLLVLRPAVASAASHLACPRAPQC